MKMNFDFGRKILILFFIALPFVLFNSCKNLLDSPSIPSEKTTVGESVLSAPTGLKASHGLRRNISLSWDTVNGAKYYDVYFAESNTADFAKIGEVETNSFDDNVGTGRTGYFKVCAVKFDGTQSSFSSIVKGTSLAEPIISGGEVTDSSATISWFMENARGIDGTDNYEGSLIFVVHWQQKNGGTPNEKTLAAAKDFTNSFYEWTIEDLSGSADYEFWIEAYLSGNQDESESSPKVDKKTLTSYTPLAPEFRATQGESAKGVQLFITLPEKVMVQTETKESPNEKKDEPYPLKFEISRRIGEENPDAEEDSKISWEIVCQYLYYNGTTTPPAETDYDDAGKGYNAGNEIKWFDESANLVGGEKYTYRIRSFVDTGYSKVVCPEGKEYNGNAATPESKASKALGWKSAHPSFKVNYSADGSRTLSADATKVLSYKLDFEAEWKDLGKAGDYKFAIKQNRKSYEENYSGSGKDAWLKNADGGDFFGTIGEIASYAVKFGSAEGGLSEADIGVYSYTLYIVPKGAGIDALNGGDESNVLDSVKAADEIVVTDAVKLPKAEFVAEGGYKDKVALDIAFEPGVKYKVIRTRLDTTPQETFPEFEIEPENPGASFKYEDKVDGNGRYSYILKAVDASGAFSLSKAQEAETLGTPKVLFEREKLCYDSVTISFDGVLAAEKYTVKLGESGGFGGGNEFSFDAGFAGTVGNAEVALAANRFTVTIKKPYGYDDATLAGKTANAIVTAHSYVDNAPSDPEPVNVVGPACLEAKVSENAAEDSITLTWKAMPGAKGYLIRRVMYEKADSENVAEDSDVTYYCDASRENDVYLAEGGNLYGRATVSLDGETFTLTDNSVEKNTSDPDLEIYQEAQAKISWGLPFRYVVLPVLDKDDFDFKGTSLELAEGGKVAYPNIERVQTEKAATWGYGLEVHAEKSKSTTEQKITWKKPYYALQKGQTSRVFRRIAGTTGKFEYVGNVEPGADSFTYTPQDDERYEAFEYAVKYALVDDFAMPDSLNAEFAENKDGESTGEQSNKGYLFTVKDDNIKLCGLSAKQGGSNEYAELVTWESAKVRDSWGDWAKRALGPTGVRLYIRNNNLDTEWHLAADIASLDYSGDVAPNSEEDVAAAGNSNGVSLYPASCASGDGATAGALKVLRDYKHYYAISLTRSNGDEENPAYLEARYTPGFDDFAADRQVYAYRQITDEEMVRAATLAMTIGIEKTGTNWETGNGGKGAKDTHTQGGGTVSVTRDGGTGLIGHPKNLEVTLQFTNYATVMQAKTKDDVSFLTLNGTVMGYTYSGGSSGERRYPKEYNGELQVYFPSDYKTEDPVDINFFWLGCESEPREPNTGDKENPTRERGIEIIQPRTQMKRFGNITPLPFGNGVRDPVWSYKDINGPLNNSEEWQ